MSPQRRRLEVGGWEREQKMMCFITCVITVWSWPVEALKPPIRGSRSVMTPSGGQILLSAKDHLPLWTHVLLTLLRHLPTSLWYVSLSVPRWPNLPLPSWHPCWQTPQTSIFSPENRKRLKYSMSPGRFRRKKRKKKNPSSTQCLLCRCRVWQWNSLWCADLPLRTFFISGFYKDVHIEMQVHAQGVWTL